MTILTRVRHQRPSFRRILRVWLAALTCCAFAFTLAGCGGSSKATPTASNPTATADFSLAAAPASVALAAGSTQQVSLTTTAINGFTSSVQVALSGLPAGVTAQPASLTLTPGKSQSVTLAATANVAASSGTWTLTGTSGSLSHTAAVTLNVTPATTPPAAPPDFSLAITPATISLAAGAIGQQVSVSATDVNGFSSTVNISLSALPAGVTASPSTLALTSGTPQSITFNASASATAGSYSVNVVGQSAALSHTAALALAVTATPVTIPSGRDAVTYHYDNSRTGLNSNETILTPTNVNASTFGKLMFLGVDGKVG